MNRRSLLNFVRALCFLFAIGSAAVAAGPRVATLHERIDEAIAAGHLGPTIKLADDADFLRRVSIDLTGMPPSPDELREFLADPFADKRDRAIERLLESPLFARQLATVFDVMLMERRPFQNVSAEEWQKYLLNAFQENKPLNLLFKEILSADGSDPKLRAASRFYLDRGSEPNLITRDVGRIVFGRDMQCAQCHNHPLIEDYQQSDYHGLLAFFSSSYPLVKKEGGKDKTFFAEKAGEDLTFDSVFVKNDKHLTGPRIIGAGEMVVPVFPPGEEYKVKPADTIMPVPKFRKREELASIVTCGTSRSFNENIANRLWAMMMGRGLVHPVDLQHPANPPVHPELLTLLGDELVAMKFNAKSFLRELALSQSYQRPIDLPEDRSKNASEIASMLAELNTHTPALTDASTAARKIYDDAIKAWYAAEDKLVPVAAERDQATAKHTAAANKQAEAQKAADLIVKQIGEKQDLAKILNEAASKTQDVAKKLPAEKDLAAASQKFSDRLKALTGELAGLEKAKVEKATVLKKVAEEVVVAVKPVEAARAKILPLREEMRKKERDVLVARGKMAEARTALEIHKRRQNLLKVFADRNALVEKTESIAKTIDAKREGVVQAQKFVAEYAPMFLKVKNQHDAAERAKQASEKTRNDAQAALDRHQKLTNSVLEAYHATDNALQQIPDDPTLTETAQKLKAKADELRSMTVKLVELREVASGELNASLEALAAVTRKLDESSAEKTRRQNAVVASTSALSEAEERAKGLRTELAALNEELATLQGNEFRLGQLKPLSPEQMAWSTLKVTGVYDRYRQTEENELNKSKPLSDQAKKDPAQVKARAFEIEQRTFDKLKGNVGAFVSVYAAGAGQPQNDFFATADQALFEANGGSVNSWIAPAGGNVADRMVREKDLPKAADDLYLTILSRSPSPDESTDVVRVLTERASNKPAAVQEVVWGLLTSAEFRFNH